MTNKTKRQLELELEAALEKIRVLEIVAKDSKDFTIMLIEALLIVNGLPSPYVNK